MKVSTYGFDRVNATVSNLPNLAICETHIFNHVPDLCMLGCGLILEGFCSGWQQYFSNPCIAFSQLSIEFISVFTSQLPLLAQLLQLSLLRVAPTIQLLDNWLLSD